MVGNATCGRAAGSEKILADLTKRNWTKPVQVVAVGCLGACFAEPLVIVATAAGSYHFFANVDTYALWDIIRTAEEGTQQPHCSGVAQYHDGRFTLTFDDLVFSEEQTGGLISFLRGQHHRVSGRCGLVNPLNLLEYAAMEGYRGLCDALQGEPAALIELVQSSGLRGRGGAGFPSGQKMARVATAEDRERYIVANSDEGDPGAYMNRALLESDPHSVIEGLIMAAYAVGTKRGYLFIRHEYTLAVATLRRAIADCYEAGLLGENIGGSSFSFHLNLVESGGAFVCGEDTSLIGVLEGRRGTPRPKPPYPAITGLYGHPTLVLNVETLANLPWLQRHGAASFRNLGSHKSPGTKMFCLAGDLAHVGYIEVPLASDTQKMVEQIGGAEGGKVKALQIGGPAGGIVPYHAFPLDYEDVQTTGASIGSGGLIVLNHQRCTVDLLCHMTRFMAAESCGQCLLCRDGLQLLTSLLLSLVEGKGDEETLARLDHLSRAVAAGALCGLGRAAAVTVQNGLRHFSEEFADHARSVCTTVYCRALVDFEISMRRCRECHACFLVCPSEAVKYRSGTVSYLVDRERCTKCYACFETCPFQCIHLTSGNYHRY